MEEESIEPQVKPQVNATKAKTSKDDKKHKAIIGPRFKPIKFKLSKINKSLIKPVRSINQEEYYSSDEYPLNKRGYRYKPCKANRQLPSLLYCTTDLAPYNVRMSYFDKSNDIIFNEGLNKISNSSNGWRSIRSNVGVREGHWYMEFNIGNCNESEGSDSSHVRLGVGRKELSLEAPVGYDGYGYGLRDICGSKLTLSRPQPYMSESFTTNDTIGLLIELPKLSDHRTHFQDKLNELNNNDNLVRDQIPIKYKNSLYFEQFEYTPTEKMDSLLNPIKIFGEKVVANNEIIDDLPKIPKSKIKIFKNGKDQGTMFEDLFSFLPIEGNINQQQNMSFKNTDDGTLGYYPMISVYKQAQVEFNPGPNFKHSIPEGAKPLSDRYNEYISEQWFWDIMDEVESEYLDDLESKSKGSNS